MDNLKEHIARILFQNKTLKLSGNGFEDFFSLVMQKSDLRFLQIKPQGRFGDRKNDGFLKEEGIYYQVYSPENPSISDGQGSKKALEDFEGLYDYWNDKCKIKKFCFVFNDKYKGTYPETISILLELGKKYNDIDFKFFGIYELESIFLSLNESDITSIVGFIPDVSDITTLEYGALSEVIDNLINGYTINFDDKLVIPNFDDKIKFNGLTENLKKILTFGGFQIGFLDEYFNKTGNKSRRNDIKNILKLHYENGLNEGLKGDNLYVFIGDKCKEKINDNNAISNAIIVLISYYFESCDIFEEPN